MTSASEPKLIHPGFHRREFLQAGACAALGGLAMSDVAALRAASASPGSLVRRPKSVIYVVLTGGLAQHESFDPKPEAPADVRGEFEAIETATPGLFHLRTLPEALARRNSKWALAPVPVAFWSRHIQATSMMLTRAQHSVAEFHASPSRPTFRASRPWPVAWCRHADNLPSARYCRTRSTRPVRKAGMMGSRHDPWFIKAASDCQWSGACPNCWDHQRRPQQQHTGWPVFQAPNLSLPDGISQPRLDARKSLLQVVEQQQRTLDLTAPISSMNTYRSGALSLLTSGKVRDAFDIENEKPQTLDAYGRNLFGYSLLFAARLVELGVGMVQVNLGRGGFDTHGNAFDHLKNLMLPPTDQALSALIDDLDARGLLEDTLIVAAGEFGRTPRIFRLPQYYELPGRDHWGTVQSVFFAGGGVRGGNVVGASDRHGGYPKEARQTPENLAATIYDALGIDPHAAWHDGNDRPWHVYHADPIAGLV